MITVHELAKQITPVYGSGTSRSEFGVLYRFDTTAFSVLLWEYAIVRKTPQGVWINAHGSEKFVLTDARKHWACETPEAAATSFFARKARQIKILKGQLAYAEASVDRLRDKLQAAKQVPPATREWE